MIDLKNLKTNKKIIEENIRSRFMNVDLNNIINLQEERSNLIVEIENLRQKRNENSQKMKNRLSDDERHYLIQEGKDLKDSITKLEDKLKDVETIYMTEAAKIPNYAHKDAPIGKEDKDNLMIGSFGTIPKFDFKAKDHIQLGEELDIIDFETATKVTGPKFYYLKNSAVILEFALIRYALDILMKKGFTPMITPDLAKESILTGIGFNPRGEESNIYTIEGTDNCLIGTAEITLGGYMANSVLEAEKLPICMAGVSHCFRKEAGGAGQYSKGLYRVHQFSKVEMFIFCEPEKSEKMHQFLLEIEKEIFMGLEIPFRIVDTCTGDLGAPAYRKFDLEAWMPGRGDDGDWGEITSTSNCTDYQSRRLNIKYKDGSGEKQFVHMLNGTAIAISRAIVAIMENFQTKEGFIKIPEKLIPYTGFNIIKNKNVK